MRVGSRAVRSEEIRRASLAGSRLLYASYMETLNDRCAICVCIVVIVKWKVGRYYGAARFGSRDSLDRGVCSLAVSLEMERTLPIVVAATITTASALAVMTLGRGQAKQQGWYCLVRQER